MTGDIRVSHGSMSSGGLRNQHTLTVIHMVGINLVVRILSGANWELTNIMTSVSGRTRQRIKSRYSNTTWKIAKQIRKGTHSRLKHAGINLLNKARTRKIIEIVKKF